MPILIVNISWKSFINILILQIGWSFILFVQNVYFLYARFRNEVTDITPTFPFCSVSVLFPSHFRSVSVYIIFRLASVSVLLPSHFCSVTVIFPLQSFISLPFPLQFRWRMSYIRSSSVPFHCRFRCSSIVNYDISVPVLLHLRSTFFMNAYIEDVLFQFCSNSVPLRFRCSSVPIRFHFRWFSAQVRVLYVLFDSKYLIVWFHWN